MLTRMDELGRPAWILAVVAAFWMFWPLGLAVLAYLAWTGRLKTLATGEAGGFGGVGQWFNLRGDRAAESHPGRGSGNKAFDDYRADTLRRLEEEQREFKEYLDRLRRARDKAEFDGFMADRRRPTAPRDAERTEQA